MGFRLESLEGTLPAVGTFEQTADFSYVGPNEVMITPKEMMQLDINPGRIIDVPGKGTMYVLSRAEYIQALQMSSVGEEA